METKKSEVRTWAVQPQEMFQKYLAKTVCNTWVEDFVDEENGEVMQIERSEIIFRRGTFIDADILPKIQFSIQAGEISGVEVSNQARAATMIESNVLSLWQASVKVGKKMNTILLYATDVQMVFNVLKDFVELNFTETFFITRVAQYESCIFIKDQIRKPGPDGTQTDDEDSEVERKFYKFEMHIWTESRTFNQSFIVNTINTDTALMLIQLHVAKMIDDEAKKLDEDPEPFEMMFEAAVQIKCTKMIEREFSMAYLKTGDDD